MGIEPTYPAWKAGVLPLNYTRTAKAFQPKDDTTERPFLSIFFLFLFLTVSIAETSGFVINYLQ